MKKLLLLIAVICLILFVFTWLSLSTTRWIWLSRSGALIIVVSIVFEYWEVLITKNAKDLSFWGTQKAHTAARVAIIITLLGTLICGFGDLLGRFF